MRVLLLIMMFAIGFSGFATVAHAFADADCVLSDTGHHADNSADQLDKNSEQTAQKQCLDCAQCCASHHAVILPQLVVPVPEQAARLALLPPVDQDGFYYPSLLRPPRNLV